MSLKNLIVRNKANREIFNHLNKKRILKIFNNFSYSLNTKDSLAIAVSGGPDSLALAFLAKCYAIKNNIKLKAFIVDHKLRKESSSEARKVKNILKKIHVQCEILTWKDRKPLKNIQSLARDKRYYLLTNECKKNNIKNLLLGHHIDDLSENFLIRIVRGSGLKGLTSFNKKTKFKDEDLYILRPLLDIEKKDLIYISKKVFNFFVEDPSNKNENFRRTRIRKVLKLLEDEGFDKKKLELTIDNLQDSEKSIKFYVDRNLKDNVFFFKTKHIYILNKHFFIQSHEIIFRSLTKIIQLLGKKYYPVRGKSIDELIKSLNSKPFVKATLGGCFIEKTNETVLISKEK